MMSKTLSLALLSGAVCIAQADKVQMEQLTPDLQAKIRAQTGSNPIDDIDRNVKNGQTSYEVGFKENGQQKELVFDQNGTLVTPSGAPALDSRKVTWRELPPAVQTTARTRVTPNAINDIDRNVKGGEVTYDIGFKQGNDQKELVISQDGKIVRDVSLPEGLVAGLTPTRGTATPSRLHPRYTRPITLTDTQTIEMNWAPASVQAEIKEVVSGANITKIEKGKFQNQTVYQTTFDMNGKPVPVQIAENGQVLYNPRSTAAVGRGASYTTDNVASQYSNVTSLVPLSAAQKVDRRSVPAPVERAIQTYAGSARIEDIDRGAWNGHNIYQVAFKDNGQNIELQIDENGNLVFDPRKASK